MAGRHILNKIFLFVVLEGEIARGFDLFLVPPGSPPHLVCALSFLCVCVCALTSSTITALQRSCHDYYRLLPCISRAAGHACDLCLTINVSHRNHRFNYCLLYAVERQMYLYCTAGL
ncbi:hypothetical protein IHE45_12G016300 [Dioscorea alata]|uniref:Uncharacterized protein n=3 Tax=Dioscorea alata TaxID=55571 RepID=A0ACB7V0A8_DIOAL|nr:hypothetical protein IHE45_12G016300 [Dioscorea alata]KAH7666745.1 hypothetical protein IHE45_12G016300 [Dioscorea alata]KAH7666746.1 hypothetical protein IHE45_12G016300 [Dioscorea alata]